MLGSIYTPELSSMLQYKATKKKERKIIEDGNSSYGNMGGKWTQSNELLT